MRVLDRAGRDGVIWPHHIHDGHLRRHRAPGTGNADELTRRGYTFAASLGSSPRHRRNPAPYTAVTTRHHTSAGPADYAHSK